MVDYSALAILIFVGFTMVYGIVFFHDIPYNIAKARNHPHHDAIHVGGWISLFTLHSIWPFLWIGADRPHENDHLDIDADQDESAAPDSLADQRRYHFRGSGKAGKA